MATTMHVSDVAELLSEGRTYFNLSPADLVEHSIRRDEAKLASNGSIVGYTNRTGRSPKDKFIVKDETTAHSVAWGAVNAPFEPEKFDALYARVMEHLRGRELYVQDLFCGADPARCTACAKQSCGSVPFQLPTPSLTNIVPPSSGSTPPARPTARSSPPRPRH